MSVKINIPKEQLQKCITDLMHTDQMCKKFNCSAYTVNNYIKEYEIDVTEHREHFRYKGGKLTEEEVDDKKKIKPAELGLNIGDPIKFEKREGIVLNINNIFFLVQFKGYKESFLCNDKKYGIDMFNSLSKKGHYRGVDPVFFLEGR